MLSSQAGTCAYLPVDVCLFFDLVSSVLPEEALWKEAVAKVKEEVADLAAKQEELEKSLQASASSSDLEASVQAPGLPLSQPILGSHDSSLSRLYVKPRQLRSSKCGWMSNRRELLGSPL